MEEVSKSFFAQQVWAVTPAPNTPNYRRSKAFRHRHQKKQAELQIGSVNKELNWTQNFLDTSHQRWKKINPRTENNSYHPKWVYWHSCCKRFYMETIHYKLHIFYYFSHLLVIISTKLKVKTKKVRKTKMYSMSQRKLLLKLWIMSIQIRILILG